MVEMSSFLAGFRLRSTRTWRRCWQGMNSCRWPRLAQPTATLEVESFATDSAKATKWWLSSPLPLNITSHRYGSDLYIGPVHTPYP